MTKKIIAVFGIIIITLGLSLIARPVFSIMNPSAVYCGALDYEYVIETNSDGSQTGYCKLPNDQSVDAWEFLTGRVALEWSYCANEGYEAKHLADSEICKSCTICVLGDGTEKEVTELMGLTFIAERCGDDTCGLFEDFKSCPVDCPSGERDMYCDGAVDGKCDPDCSKEEDSDCKEELKEEKSTPSTLSSATTTLVASTEDTPLKISNSLIALIFVLLFTIVYLVGRLRGQKNK